MLLGKEELEKVWALRKSMNDSHEYTEAFVKKLADTKTNQEFLDSLDTPSNGTNKGKVKNSAS
jgi:transcription termination factor Rho